MRHMKLAAQAPQQVFAALLRQTTELFSRVHRDIKQLITPTAAEINHHTRIMEEELSLILEGYMNAIGPGLWAAYIAAPIKPQVIAYDNQPVVESPAIKVNLEHRLTDLIRLTEQAYLRRHEV